MTTKSAPPSIEKVAFDCPHCEAYTTHTWYEVTVAPMTGDERFPGVLDPSIIKHVREDNKLPEEEKDRLFEYVEKVLRGLVVINNADSPGTFTKVSIIFT